MLTSKHAIRAAARTDHPMAATVAAFEQARETCRHYRGIKSSDASRQCTHAGHMGSGNWCAMDFCPLLRQCAGWVGVGWN
jgi:hypothetical protein